MANLSFIAGGRRRRIYRRKLDNGSLSDSYYVRIQVNGKDIPRSLGTNVPAAAIEKAKQIIEAETNGDHEKARRLKIRSDYCALEEIGRIHIWKFGTDDRRRRSARGNVGCLKKIVKLAAGAGLDSRANILTGELIRNFEKAQEKRIMKDARGNMDQESERRIRESICSTVRQARSIFKPGTMNWFAELALPNLDDFRRQGVTPPDRPRPKPLDDEVIAQINAAAPALAAKDPACYVSHLLFKFLGMRNREQKFARRSWILRDGKGGGKLGVIYRPQEGFKPKKKTEGWIPIAPSVLAELDRYYSPSPDGDFLVPAQSKTDRENIIDKRHAAWAGRWIKDHIKVSYELRRYAGAMVYKKSGKIEYTQQFLRHADLKTTMEWYWYLLDKTPAIELSDCAVDMPRFKVVA